MAIAAMMPMIATTISSSISVKPFWFFIKSPFGSGFPFHPSVDLGTARRLPGASTRYKSLI
jgi:hypothetical protein